MSAFMRWTVLTTMAAAGLAAWGAAAQVAPRAPVAPARAPVPAVATVGDRRIAQTEFDQRVAQGVAPHSSCSAAGSRRL